MASERLLNYNFNYTIQQKRNIVSNLTDRAILLSSETFHNTNICKIKQILLSNDYPKKFIEQCIKNRLRKIKFPNETTFTNNQPQATNFLTNVVES